MVVLGIGVGVLSGFFGIGGGTILVPILLLMGYGIKVAIGISVVQMVFSSVYGSFLNFKKGSFCTQSDQRYLQGCDRFGNDYS